MRRPAPKRTELEMVSFAAPLCRAPSRPVRGSQPRRRLHAEQRVAGGGPLCRPVMIPLATNQLPQLIVYSRKDASPASGSGGASTPCTSCFICMLCCFCLQGHRGSGSDYLCVGTVCQAVLGPWARQEHGLSRGLCSLNLYFISLTRTTTPTLAPRRLAGPGHPRVLPNCI